MKAHLLHQNSLDDDIFNLSQDKQLSPTSKKDVKNYILTNSKSILGKVLSPTHKDKNSINASQHSNLSQGNQTPPPAEIIPTEDDQEIMQQKPQQISPPASPPANFDINAANVS